MRVISGVAKGRLLKSVTGKSTRPTSDKVKEAVFSMIGPYFEGGFVLDLFAGTGGLGIEALSRGMGHAVFIDKEKASVSTIHENLQMTGLSESAEVYRTDAVRALHTLGRRKFRFDLVFLDPPYNLRTIEQLLALMNELQLLNDQAKVIVEHDASYRIELPPHHFRCDRQTHYGDIAISVYRYTKIMNEGDFDGVDEL